MYAPLPRISLISADNLEDRVAGHQSSPLAPSEVKRENSRVTLKPASPCLASLFDFKQSTRPLALNTASRTGYQSLAGQEPNVLNARKA